MNQISTPEAVSYESGREFGFALSVAAIIALLFMPLPPFLIDMGLALSIASAVLILMVSLWIRRPLEFSSFPTILLIVTMMRLGLNVATTRIILTNGIGGHASAGYVISGFAEFIVGGEFVIGIVIFLILLTVNFIVITKGASRIAEVGARFALDAIPGKQMAIDADLSAGLIDDREAQRRRRELEEESSFFGAMDGASKFVRGDAVAGLVITVINVVGGITLATSRHGMPLGEAIDTFARLSIGDGLVTQMPALIISLAAGLVVAKGGTHGPVERAVLGQLTGEPKALLVAGGVLLALAMIPGLPFVPFACLASTFLLGGYFVRLRRVRSEAAAVAKVVEAKRHADDLVRKSVRNVLRINEIEIVFGQQLSAAMLRKQDELTLRVAKLRRKFAQQYGFVIPEMHISDDFSLAPKVYQIRMQGVTVASQELSIGDVLVIVGDGPKPSISGVEAFEPAFGLRSVWIPDIFSAEVKREGFTVVDVLTVMLTHIGEAIKNNLAQLFSYRDLQQLLDGLSPEYKRLLDEIRPAHISFSGIQAVLKTLLGEGVSIRNLPLVLEAIAECAPHSRRTEHVVEHVRQRISQQICGDLAKNGILSVLRLGSRWDLAFHESLRRGQGAEAIEFDADPRIIEEFSRDAAKAIKVHHDKGEHFVLVCTPEARPFVRMVIERIQPSLAVLSHAELSRNTSVRPLGSIS